MQIGIITYGETGFNLAERFRTQGHDVVLFDVTTTGSTSLLQSAQTATSLQDLAEKLSSKRVIWLSLPVELIDETLSSTKHYLSVSDIMIDIGPSDYRVSVRRAAELEALQIYYLDCGISEESFGQGIVMVGGNKFEFNYCESLFKLLARENGYLYCGRSGSGHFANMLRKTIDTQDKKSIAECLTRLKRSEYNLQLEEIIRLWSLTFHQETADLLHESISKIKL